MATATFTDCSQLESQSLERVKYFARQLLTADDMTADQEYYRNKMRRHNRYLHGWGVVCGMQVTAAPAANAPWQVQIGSGYALGPYGDEVYIPNPLFLDLAQCGPGAETDPCDPGSLLRGGTARTGATLFIAVRYEECYARPVRVAAGGCGCQETSCEPSRIRDTFQIECLAELSASHQPGAAGPSICELLSGRALAQCPPCPADPWVVLAQVSLPVASGTPISQQQIDNFVRRQVFSTTAIQDQVIRCCCAGQERRPARVTSINPANGVVFTSASTVPPSVIVTFSKNLQPATVNTNTIRVLRIVAGTQSVELQGTVLYDDGSRSARFTPAQAFTVPAVYQVTVIGSGPSTIVDNDNLALDGNDDGQPGGNFLSQFTVKTPLPTVTPTTPSGPLIGVLQAVPVNVPRSEVALVGELALAITGGTTGQTTTANIQVFLNAPLANATDTAQLTDPRGQTFQGTKSANSYLFTGVPIVAPGANAQSVFKITNMKVNATVFGGGSAGIPAPVQASMTISPTSIQLNNPIVTVAFVIG